MAVVQEGQLQGLFKGFHNQQTLFEFSGGGSWRQNEYRYQHHLARTPNAKVVEEGGRYLLYVEGMGEPVEVVRAVAT